MPFIKHEIQIAAPAEICFDLARNVELFSLAMLEPKQKPVAGVTKGLMAKGDTVTWESTHFGVRQLIAAEITEMDRPNHFTDVMIKGVFQSFETRHDFKETEKGTLMRTEFNYRSPFSIAGKIADKLLLERYMNRVIAERAEALKRLAEQQAGSTACGK